MIGALTGEEHVKNLRNSGHESEIFDVTNLPAICEDEENDPLGRKEGEALFPEYRGVKFLHAVRAQFEAAGKVYEWDSQYQGRPAATGSGQVETGNFIYIDSSEVPDNIQRARAWDLALGEKDRNDYIAGVLGAYDDDQDKLYLIDLWHGRKSWPKMRPILLNEALEDKEFWDCHLVGIEAVAGFGAVYQDVKAALMGEVKVVAVFPPKGGKLTSAIPWFNKIEARRVYLVRGAWTAGFIEELRTFPDGDHDDRVDAVSRLWEMLTGRQRNGGKKSVDPVRPNGANRPATGTARPQAPVEEDDHEETEDEAYERTAAELFGKRQARPNPLRR